MGDYFTEPPVRQSEASACPVTGMGAEFKPFQSPYLDDPYPFLARARVAEPVFYSPEIDHWIVTHYEDVKTILRDTKNYSSEMAQSPIKPWPKEAVEKFKSYNLNIPPVFTNNQPPSHTEVRRFVNDAFTPKRIRWLEPEMRRMVNEAIDKMIHKGSGDLMKDVLYETPARILLYFLGMPQESLTKVKQWSGGRTLLTWGKLSDQEIIDLMPNFAEYVQFCHDLVEERSKNLGDDYTSELLLKKQNEDWPGITQTMIATMIFGLLIAGHETTSNQSGLAFRALLNHRDQWEAICEDPSLIPNAVEEIIRYDSSNISWRRVAKRDMEVKGVTIPKGAQIMVMLSAANRDESVFEDGERFDIRRKRPQRHLSFGNGIHYCLGSPMARLQMRVFLEEFTKRIPSLRLAEGQSYKFPPNATHRGLVELWCEWDDA
ncbi:MAG: cytochrome P450 [Chloroflexota bacterium]